MSHLHILKCLHSILNVFLCAEINVVSKDKAATHISTKSFFGDVNQSRIWNIYVLSVLLHYILQWTVSEELRGLIQSHV